MNRPEAILSDADGTLVDTLHLIRHGQYETSKLYIEQLGLADRECPNYDTYEQLLNQTVGTSARDTLEKTLRLLYHNQPHHLKGMDFDALHDLLNPIQDKIAPEFVKAYDGLSDFLSQLGNAGIKLAIFTSGTPHHIVRNFGVALPKIDLADLYIDTSTSDVDKLSLFVATVKQYYGISEFTVVTCDDTTTHKPDPESLKLAMNRLGVTPAHSLVLGDHKVDMQSGINAGVVQRIGVTHGFNDRPTLEAAGASRVIDSLAELTLSLV